MLGQCSLLILRGPGSGEPWDHWEIALGVRSCLATKMPERPSLPCSLPAPTAVPAELWVRFCLKWTFSEGYQLWPVLAHSTLRSWLPFCVGLCSAKTQRLWPMLRCKTQRLCEAQKWEKVAFVTVDMSRWELVNSAKGWFFEPSPLPRDIHAHAQSNIFFWGILNQNLPIPFYFPFLPDPVQISFGKILCCLQRHSLIQRTNFLNTERISISVSIKVFRILYF